MTALTPTAAPTRTRVHSQARFETATLLRTGEQLLVARVLPAMALVSWMLKDNRKPKA